MLGRFFLIPGACDFARVVTDVIHETWLRLPRADHERRVQRGRSHIFSRKADSYTMILKALVLCADEKIVRVLRRTLSDLEISMELCGAPESALRKLTRERFEAIIVDLAGSGAAEVLGSARSAQCNKRAVAVAVVDTAIGLRSVFDLGAHFVLYKPVSVERAKSSFRAARALMKRERRRNIRIPLQIPVAIRSLDSIDSSKVTTSDLSEGGMAVSIPKRGRPSGKWQVSFSLSGSEAAFDLAAEFAWEGTSAQAGLRFVQVSPDDARRLQDWIAHNSAEAEQDDPPVRCQLTDLSMGGCYLEIQSPFPASTRVTISMRAAAMELRAEGVVRVMHPDRGMGVEFTQTTPQHREGLEKFLAVLTENRDVRPELLVQPEGLETDTAASTQNPAASPESGDPLLGLFRNKAMLAPEAFLGELQKQRGTVAASTAAR
jgi:c-di-GMP-binding flagellar brake protein YcgR